LPSATKCTGAVFLAALRASPVRADENLAGTGSVAEWRTKLGRSELATAAYAAGVMATGNLFSECKNPRTVRDLHTYLLYRAPSTLTMKQAIGSFFSEGDCMAFGEDRLAPSNPPNWRTKATIHREGP
jgi:hypothetical protein